ncbi:MAG: hypothetical protein PHD76_05080 [Methylacidiphilales bacterium]|nr:hypothetical protein [Candidatus Methylacidiphilales bacterium]
MGIDQLSSLVALILALSVASERLVEILKGLSPFLNTQNVNPVLEGRRKAMLQFMAMLGGVLTSWLAWPAINTVKGLDSINPYAGVLALGLLASGGSGLWNSVLTYFSMVKEVKKNEANIQGRTAKARAR